MKHTIRLNTTYKKKHLKGDCEFERWRSSCQATN